MPVRARTASWIGSVSLRSPRAGSAVLMQIQICLFSREIFSANLAPDVRENLFGRRLRR